MLRPRLTDVVEEVIAAVAVAVPAYARPLEGRFGDGVRQGVEVALGRFLELPGTTEPALTPDSRRVYAALGRGEVRQGRTLDGLLSAYRAGARVTLRRMSRDALEAGLDTEALVALGESILAYIEELSAASAEGSKPTPLSSTVKVASVGVIRVATEIVRDANLGSARRAA